MTPQQRFKSFFEALYGVEPFPWQIRLLERFLSGDVPEWVHIPTGCGKSAIADIWLFALSEQAPIGRRMILVNNRRVSADEMHDRISGAAAALKEARSGILKEVADRLRAIGGDESPLSSHLLRGGMYHPELWASTPTQPTFISGTVAQIGSRLLFRPLSPGGNRAAPIYAGLLANDALIVVDEAGSSAFYHTLALIARYRKRAANPIPVPFHLLGMDAALSQPGAFTLDEEDYACPTLLRRLRAQKPTTLVSVKRPATAESIARALAEQALELAKHPQRRAIGVIANQVPIAMRCFELLKATNRRAILLIGRMRPVDQDAVKSTPDFELFKSTHSSRRTLDAPIFLVTTQTVESGADFDFDGLVTMSASANALIQRFGRLNRTGRDIQAQGVVLHPDWVDPTYGEDAELAVASIWGGQGASQAVDMSYQSLDDLGVAKLIRPRQPCAVLAPHHLDALCQSGPASSYAPDVNAFLRDEHENDDDVLVVLREDLPPPAPETAAVFNEALQLATPTPYESMPLPWWALAKWMEGAAPTQAAPDADIPLAAQPVTPRPQTGRWVFVLRASESEPTGFATCNPQDIVPGDTVVLSVAGGEDWKSMGYFVDLDDAPERASVYAPMRGFLRLTQARAARLSCPSIDALLAAYAQGEDVAPPQVKRALDALARAHPHLEPVVARLTSAPIEILPYLDGILVREERAPKAPEDIRSSLGRKRIALEPHLRAVGAKAAQLARLCRLPDPIARDLEFAGTYHDIGKAAPHFQRALYALDGRDYVPTSEGRLLAKTTKTRRTTPALPQGLPSHELVSEAIARRFAPSECADADLALHLIASHHGLARPMPYAAEQTSIEGFAYTLLGKQIEFNSDQDALPAAPEMLARFWRLTRRYGWWGLPYLEAILRCANHLATAEK